MSWDFHMESQDGVRLCFDGVDNVNYTWNVSKMYRLAFGIPDGKSVTDWLDGRSGWEAHQLIAGAIFEMETHPEKFTPLEPGNGWGSYRGALDTLRILNEWCARAPSARLCVW